MRRRNANASIALVAPICRPRWNQLRGPALGANLMARFPSPKANLPSGTNPGLDQAGVLVGAQRWYRGVQLELDVQPFSASAFSARLVHNSAISTRIAFWCGSALRAIRLHSSANFRYVPGSPIIRSFASQSAVCYLDYADPIPWHQ